MFSLLSASLGKHLGGRNVEGWLVLSLNSLSLDVCLCLFFCLFNSMFCFGFRFADNITEIIRLILLVSCLYVLDYWKINISAQVTILTNWFLFYRVKLMVYSISVICDVTTLDISTF